MSDTCGNYRPKEFLACRRLSILALDGSGPKETIDVLQRANVPFVVVPDKFTGDGIVDKIDVIAGDVGVAERGECLAGMVRNPI